MAQEATVEKSKQRPYSKFLFNNIDEAVFIFDLDLNLIRTNKNAQRIEKDFKLFTYKDRDYRLEDLPIVKKTSKKAIDFCESQNRKKITRNIIETKAYDEYGLEHHFTLKCLWHFEREPGYIYVVLNDVTNLKRKIRQVEDLVSAMVHDLKTPLIATDLNLKHLISGDLGEIGEKQIGLLELLRKSNAGSLKLVENLLSVLKYETDSQKLYLEAVSSHKLISKIINELESLTKKKSISLNIIGDDFEFTCDPFEIARVLTNLISNAIKFSEPNSNIDISLEANDKAYIFSIEDHGKGMDEQELESVFERFWQAGSKEIYNPKGTGLGLYISRQIIESHGGKIWIDSEKNKGTKVSFELPSSIEQS